LTSLGMSRLSRPPAKEPSRDRVIAMWRDAVTGVHEIELGSDQDAVLLNVVCESREEFTCDGRGDGGRAHFPILAGYRGLEVTTPRARASPGRK
jgi:hypothetical protein